LTPSIFLALQYSSFCIRLDSIYFLALQYSSFCIRLDSIYFSGFTV